MNHDETVTLATKALTADIREDPAGVSSALEKIAPDPQAVAMAIKAYCDWIISAQCRLKGLPEPGDGEAVPGLARPGWVNLDTGKVDLNANAVPADVRWCGQLVAARAAMDQDNYDALLQAMPDDGHERMGYLVTLLHGCADTMRLLNQAGRL